MSSRRTKTYDNSSVDDDQFQDDSSDNSGSPTKSLGRWQKERKPDISLDKVNESSQIPKRKRNHVPPSEIIDDGASSIANGGSSSTSMIPKKSIPKKSRHGSNESSLLSESLLKEGIKEEQPTIYRSRAQPSQHRSRTPPSTGLSHLASRSSQAPPPTDNISNNRANVRTEDSNRDQYLINDAQRREKEGYILTSLCKMVKPFVNQLTVHSSCEDATIFSSPLTNKEKGIDWEASFAKPLNYLDEQDNFDSKVPLFSEEFQNGKSEHPLHWWGVSQPPTRHVAKKSTMSNIESKRKKIDDRKKRKHSFSDNRTSSRGQGDNLRGERTHSIDEPQSYSSGNRYHTEYMSDGRRENIRHGHGHGHGQYRARVDEHHPMGAPFDDRHGRRPIGYGDDRYGPMPPMSGSRERDRLKNERRQR